MEELIILNVAELILLMRGIATLMSLIGLLFLIKDDWKKACFFDSIVIIILWIVIDLM